MGFMQIVPIELDSKEKPNVLLIMNQLKASKALMEESNNME